MGGLTSPGGTEAAAAGVSALLSSIPCHKVPGAMAHTEVTEALRHVAALERMLGGWGAQVGWGGAHPAVVHPAGRSEPGLWLPTHAQNVWANGAALEVSRCWLAGAGAKRAVAIWCCLAEHPKRRSAGQLSAPQGGCTGTWVLAFSSSAPPCSMQRR